MSLVVRARCHSTRARWVVRLPGILVLTVCPTSAISEPRQTTRPSPRRTNRPTISACSSSRCGGVRERGRTTGPSARTRTLARKRGGTYFRLNTHRLRDCPYSSCEGRITLPCLRNTRHDRLTLCFTYCKTGPAAVPVRRQRVRRVPQRRLPKGAGLSH